MNWRFWRRPPSPELKEAQAVRKEIEGQRGEVDRITNSLRRNVREPNGLAPLLERVIRSTR